MKIRYQIVWSFLILVFSNVSLPQTSQDCGVSNGPVLARQVCDADIRNAKVSWGKTHIIWLLPRVFSSVKTPAGISLKYPRTPELDPLCDFTPNSFILRDILDKAITVQPQYKWSEENGVINVTPLDDYPILGTHIKKFRGVNITRTEALNQLLNLKNFERYFVGNGLREGDDVFIGPTGRMAEKKISIDLRNVTVTDVLNEIVRQDGNSMWIYSEMETQNTEDTVRYYKLTISHL